MGIQHRPIGMRLAEKRNARLQPRVLLFGNTRAIIELCLFFWFPAAMLFACIVYRYCSVGGLWSSVGGLGSSADGGGHCSSAHRVIRPNVSAATVPTTNQISSAIAQFIGVNKCINLQTS